jgi:F-type H+-transporting ATPase subunit a
MNVPVAAETLFHLGPLPVTNSLIMGWVAVILCVLLAWRLNRKLVVAPRGLQNVMEWLLESIMGFMDQVTSNRAKSRRFLPIVGTMFLLILASNWLGLFSLVLPITLKEGHENIPILRAATSDLNLTLAMALFSVVISHLLGFIALGFWKYGNKFIKLGDLWHALKAFGSKPIGEAGMGLFVAVIEFFVGLLEIVSEIAKVISLSLRLFGNIYAGEVLLAVIVSLTGKLPPFLLPLPFIAMELLVGIVQASVFSILTLVYLTSAVEAPHGEHEEAHAEPQAKPAVAPSH